MRKIGKVGKQNIEANKALKELYATKGITVCEARLDGCSKTFGLSWHHRHKRSSGFYRDKPFLLSSFKHTILVCANCHDKLEYDKELTELVFLGHRGPDWVDG